MKISELKTILRYIETETDIPVRVKCCNDKGEYQIVDIKSFRAYSDCIILNSDLNLLCFGAKSIVMQ